MDAYAALASQCTRRYCQKSRDVRKTPRPVTRPRPSTTCSLRGARRGIRPRDIVHLLPPVAFDPVAPVAVHGVAPSMSHWPCLRSAFNSVK